MGDHGIKQGGKNLLDLDYVDDLSILDETMTKMYDLLEVLLFQYSRIGLKIIVKKTFFYFLLLLRKLLLKSC